MDKFVCAACIEIRYFGEIIDDDPTSGECSYCGTRECNVVNLEIVANVVEQVIGEYWEDAGNSVPYESREGGYQFPVDDTYEVVSYNLLVEIETREIVEDILNLLPDQVLFDSKSFFDMSQFDIWEFFCGYIKHDRRFLLSEDQEFSKPLPAKYEGLTPLSFLNWIAKELEEYSLIKTLPKGAKILRARRYQGNFNPSNPKDLGPPPQDLAIQANRMTPAGIPAFYGASDSTTAMLEIDLRAMEECIVASFGTMKNLTYLDLPDVPQIRSIFDVDNRYLRDSEIFLNRFIEDLIKPIARDEKVHIEYVPTQMVTEFLRLKFKLDAIRFSSNLTDGDNWVVFIDQYGIVSQEPGEPSQENCLLEMIDSQLATYSIEISGLNDNESQIRVQKYAPPHQE